MIVLGINPGYDATAALVVNGEVASVVEEERLSRVKMHLGFPRRAIREVLRIAGVDPADIAAVTFPFVDYLSAHPVITRMLLREGGAGIDPENPIDVVALVRSIGKSAQPRDLLAPPVTSSKRNESRNQRVYLGELARLGIVVDRLVRVDHHVAHAASAYYFSGFGSCLVVTADGCGDGRSLTVSVGREGSLQEIREVSDDVSAGYFYAGVTSYLGFRAHRHEGKVTGLAAFGDPRACYEHLVPCLGVSADRRSLTSGLAHASTLRKVANFGRILRGRYYRRDIMNEYARHFAARLPSYSREDVAAAAQQRLEDVLAEYLRPILRETGLRRLALAGGVFANVKLNQRLCELDDVDEIFVHPSMGDGGTALGSAFLAHAQTAGGWSDDSASRSRLRDVYLGPEFSDAEIEGELVRRHLAYRRCDDIEAAVADRLAAKRIVGRFSGRMEYGPRALGNRSILAHPGDASVNTTLNQRLHRSEFMPFAPSVLREDAAEYFELGAGNLRAAEFMTVTCRVRTERRSAIAAVCHLDGTARPHVVRPEINASFHRVLGEFKRLTGLGVIVNTSFNLHEEPIVATPADACAAFERNAVDALAIGPFMVER